MALLSSLLCLAAPLAAFAQVTPEALSAEGAQMVLRMQMGAVEAPVFSPDLHSGAPSGVAIKTLALPGEEAEKTGLDPIMAPLQQNKGKASAVSKEVDLPSILNKHLKTSLQFTLGGATIWVSGGFDRSQNAFVSILEDGKAVRYFNVKSLLSSEPVVSIGSGQYKLVLHPDLISQMDSEVAVVNTSNRRDQQSVTLKELLTAVSAAGERVALTGQTYSLFYYDEIISGGTDPTKKNLAFMLTDSGGEFHIFMVPLEQVPASGMAVFKMYQNKPVGLQRSGDKLQIVDNP